MIRSKLRDLAIWLAVKLNGEEFQIVYCEDGRPVAAPLSMCMEGDPEESPFYRDYFNEMNSIWLDDDIYF
jgi:hypothetical protein